MKLVACLVLLLNTFSFSQSYPHIFELRGLEDSLNNTHLFYRYVYPTTTCWSKSIYHLNVTNGSDTFYIYDAASDPIGEGCRGQFIFDYESFSANPSYYIYGGYDFYLDPAPILIRYDELIQIPGDGIGGITEIEISMQNENLVYAALDGALFKSTDGGYNFTIDLDSLAWIDNSMISLSRNNDSQIYGIDDSKLVRSEDEGYSYTIVDYADWRDNSELFYDADGNHIYGLSISYIFQTHSYNSKIYKSSENGNPFTWNTLLEYSAKIWFTLDETQSGEIYHSAGKQIFKSTDFGATFDLFTELAFNITGLYKKADTNILYASTPLRIYEITPDTTQVIKRLPIPDEVLNFYPLAIGNKWIYDEYYFSNGNLVHYLFIREVNGIYLEPNGQLYYILKAYSLGQPGEGISYERIDSSSAKIYRYDENLGLPNNEYMIDDLLAEPGDTVFSHRMGFSASGFTIVLDESSFEKWGLIKTKRVFVQHNGLPEPFYSLSEDIGLDSMYFDFTNGSTNTYSLKGCIIDGTVYGDTTVVSVEDDEPPLPFEFELAQNYPNPFNPSTTIKYQIPKLSFVTIKVYDVLGNEIVTLVNEEKPVGSYDIEFNATNLPSGIYFYQLRVYPAGGGAGNFIQTRKMVLLKWKEHNNEIFLHLLFNYIVSFF